MSRALIHVMCIASDRAIFRVGWRSGGVLLALGWLLLPWSLGANALAADFEMPLKVQATTATETVGAEVIPTIQAGARTGYDGGLDTLAYRVGPIQAWLWNAASPPGAQAMKRDVRAGVTEERWALQVVTPSNTLGAAVAVGTAVTLSWNPPASNGRCSGRSVSLEDPQTGTLTDMTASNRYTFLAPGPTASYNLNMVVGVAQVGVVPPAAPAGLVSPRRGRRGVLLAWSAVGTTVYHVERIDHPLDPATRKVTRLTAHPLRETRWLDGQIVGNDVVAYRVVAVAGSGCESDPSAELLVTP